MHLNFMDETGLKYKSDHGCKRNLYPAYFCHIPGGPEVLYRRPDSRRRERMRSMKKKPNIIFIITDDQGAWAVESETNHDIKTQNLKRLAEAGVTFDEFYCTSPVCSLARASIVI